MTISLIDLNGHKLAFNDAQLKTTADLVIYGKKADSEISFNLTVAFAYTQCLLTTAARLYIVCGKYSANGNPNKTNNMLFRCSPTAQSLPDMCRYDFYGATMSIDIDTSKEKYTTKVYGIALTDAYREFENVIVNKCNISINGHGSYAAGVNTALSTGNYLETLLVSDTAITVKDDTYVGTNINDQTGHAIKAKGVVLIENSTLDATNCALDFGRGLIRNSTLIGGVHGGIYSAPFDYNNIGRYQGVYIQAKSDAVKWMPRLPEDTNWAYVQNCVLRREDKQLSGDVYDYACYISGDIWFDGCTFEVAGKPKGPAIKKQSYYDRQPRPYFSNCEMGDNIRVDSGCIAYFGKGMSKDIKAINGGKIEYTSDTYAAIPVVTTKYVQVPDTATTTSET